ncbi:MAG TPA: hypothetical protein DCM87_07115 [Planctomycetes bacterium]|nr:hypothetical protein [Planctomycetota bacterium]
MRRTAAVASIMFALGFLGVRLARPPAPVEESAPPVREAPHAAVPAIAAAPAEDASPKTPEDLRARIEELLAAVPPAVSGTGIIAGRVTTRSGEPLPGARIHAEPAGEDGRGEGDVPTAAVLDLIARHGRSREATADAEGAFTLAGLEACIYEVSAELPGYEVHSIGGHASVSAKSGDTIQLIGRRLAEVPVVLVLPDGTMPADGRIACLDEAGKTWRPPRTSLFLPRGDYDLKGSASHEGGRYESAVRSISIAEGRDVPEVGLALEHKLAIRGLVRVSDAWLGVRLRVSVREPGEDEDSESGHVDDGGGFEFTGLDPGTYLVRASRFEGHTAVERVVELAGKDAAIELVLPPLSPDDYTVLRVLAPDGTPLSRYSYELAWPGDTAHRKDGTCWLFPTRAAQEQHLSMSVRVRAPGYGDRRVSFGRDVREVVVRFAEPAALEVTWSALDPRLARRDVVDLHFSVELVELETRQKHDARARAAAGRLRVFGLPPGMYTAAIEAQCGFSTRMCSTEIDLRSGENRFDVPLGGVSTLTVVVDPALRGKDLAIRSLGIDPPISGSSEIGDDGVAVLPLLPPGEYRLAVHGSSSEGDMRVMLPGPADVRFEPRPAGGLLVLDVEGIEEAGLRNGDRIVAVEGAAVTSAPALRAAVLSARSRRTVKIAVVRGEARVELDVDPDAIADESHRFWPVSLPTR